jgi:hypothetical protein
VTAIVQEAGYGKRNFNNLLTIQALK